MPDKRLIADSLSEPVSGKYCTLGAVGAARGLDLSNIDPTDSNAVSELFGIARAMVKEIVYENDQAYEFFKQDNDVTEEGRWRYMRRWAQDNLVEK